MRIVVIDDSQINLVLLQNLVSHLPDCESVAFLDPVQALAWCQDNEPDLVITDYMMPVMDGIQLCRQFRLIPGCENIPVLMVTVNLETSVRHDALADGVTDFLNKPLDMAEFLARTKNMLALRKSYKQLSNHAEWLADEVRKATTKILAREQETIFCLARAAEYRDLETGAHIKRMSHYSHHIARCLGLTVEQQELLLESAPMHDIGKVGIPDLILLKPGKLTAIEFSVMKQHPVIGYEILNASNSPLLKVAAEIAYTHHEKFDGSGYPRGLAGDAIPLYGRIVAVADVFDALTTERPYKKAWETDMAQQLLRKAAGTHFDPVCVEAFCHDWDAVLDIKNTFIDETRDIRDDLLD